MVSFGLTLGGKYSLLTRKPVTLCSGLPCLCSCLPVATLTFSFCFQFLKSFTISLLSPLYFPSPHRSPSRAVCPISTAQPLQPEHEVVPEGPGNGTDCCSMYSPEVKEPCSLLVKPFVNLVANSERVQRPMTWPSLGEFSGEQ